MTEWHARDYHHVASLQKALAEEQLGRLTLAGDEHVLDVGCGDGTITAEIAGRVPRGSVVGVDPSRDMVAYASDHFGPPQYANLRFEVGDARQLPFRGAFDLVISFNALHWVREQDAALASIRAALKPGGRALLRFVPQGHRESLEDVIEKVRRRAKWSGCFTDFQAPYVHFTAGEYRTLAERASFVVRRLDVEDRAWDFQTRDAFVAFGRATFVEWSQHVPEAERDAFVVDVLDHYQTVVAERSQEANTFKFYQMEIELVPAVDQRSVAGAPG